MVCNQAPQYRNSTITLYELYEHESPDAFLARKKLMAILAGAEPQIGGDYDNNVPVFASATYAALNKQTKNRLDL